jgi:trk system potassium uptake protein TrkA
MNVIIAGGGRTGTQLALFLSEQNHHVRIIEHRRDILSRLHHELPTETIYEGEPADPDVLAQAGICEAHVLAACTDNDAENLAICFLAKTKYKVPRTIARVNNPRAAWLFDDKFRVDAAVNQAEIMSSIIEEEMSVGDMMTLLKLRRGEYSLVEEKIPAGAKAIGVAIRDLSLPEHCVIAAVIRHDEIVLPRGSLAFEEGDEVFALTDREGATCFADLFGSPKELAS